MKRGYVLLGILLILSVSFVLAKEVEIPNEGTFEIDKDISGKALSDPPREVTNYYVASKLLASEDDSGKIVDYVQDRLGNNRVTIDNGRSNGEIKNLPFGQELKNTAQSRFTFSGKELDEDLYNFGARSYDPDVGKFTAVDPVEDDFPYSYVHNNPMNLVDPTGKAAKGWDMSFDKWWSEQFTRSLHGGEFKSPLFLEPYIPVAYYQDLDPVVGFEFGYGLNEDLGNYVTLPNVDLQETISTTMSAFINYPLYQFNMGRFQIVPSVRAEASQRNDWHIKDFIGDDTRQVSKSAGIGLNAVMNFIYGNTPLDRISLNLWGPHGETSTVEASGIIVPEWGRTEYTGHLREGTLFRGFGASVQKSFFGGYISVNGFQRSGKDSMGGDLKQKSVGATYERAIAEGSTIQVGADANWLQNQNLDNKQTYAGNYFIQFNKGPVSIGYRHSPHTENSYSYVGARFALPGVPHF